MFWHFFLSSPDYLNNLSPDSKEYEDTQGKAAEWGSVIFITIIAMFFQWSNTICMHTAAARYVSGPSCWVTVSVCLYSIHLDKSLSFFLCLCCSCLGDRVRGGWPGQWQSETGGEFTLDTLHVFITFTLFSPCWAWYIFTAQRAAIEARLYSLFGNERAILGWSWSVKKLDS